MPSISTIASPQPHIFTINDDSNEPTLPYGFGRQLPIVPPNLNDLNLPPNPFNILATMAVVLQTQNTHDDNYSPHSPEPSELSSISTPPMNVSAYNSWETTHSTTDDNTFYSEDEPRRVYWTSPWAKRLNPKKNPGGSMSYHRFPHRRHRLQEHRKGKKGLGMSFPRKGECRSTSAKPAGRRSQQ